MKDIFHGFLRDMVSKGASDVHIRVGSAPVFRIDGKLVLSENQVLTAEDTRNITRIIFNEKQKKSFEEHQECDLSYQLEDIGRFRINVFIERGNIHMALRFVPSKIPDFQELNLPSVLEKISQNQRGLVLLTGTTGCGKSTTLAAMINYINEHRPVHIITIEDPIEYMHKDKKAIISQRELGLDTFDYPMALKHVVRQDPDVILIGEMRDLDTMHAAISAAQTGHLVLSTVHTIDTCQTITRIVDMFPPHQQTQIRYQLADSLKAVISQRLLPRASEKGMVPAAEIMVVTGLIRKLVEEDKLGEISTAVQQGEYYGMQTFNQSLVKLYNDKKISLEEAKQAASNPEEFMLYVRGIHTGVE